MSEQTLPLSELRAFLANRRKLVITTHVNPDGDAIGSEIGMADWLRSSGREVQIINHSPTPHNHAFLDAPTSTIEQFDPTKHDAIIRQSDGILLLDVNDPDRARSTGPYLTLGHPEVAVIDHHLEPKQFASLYVTDTDATSTGELVYRIIRDLRPTLGGTISPQGAMALYVAIMTDTGSFRFPRTDSDVLRICADLIDAGADPVRAYDEVYNQSPAARLLLMRACLNSLQYFHGATMAIQYVLQSDLLEIGASEEDVDGFVQMPFQVAGIRLSVFVLELRNGWKLSVRSKGNVSAASIAQHFGGNGHFHAAGARVYDDRNLEAILREIELEGGRAIVESGLESKS